MNNLKELKIWNKAIDLAVNVYKATSTFPNDERFGLISQSRRAAVSIPSNIAEGAGRNSTKEFNHFLGIANGSSYELQTQLVIANKLAILESEILDPLLTQIDELQKMTYGFQQMLEKKINKKT
ncbi:four helix bundle protein [Pedobacter ginsenosidimutans]|uniref:Four helix bundle protein n=1 Tax=Pedobacter ginsenosidimutans TaxID=687842 RepID=A0A0T5VN87_9SPHI|nr:four helix bundle protein [Pedobacter ginsenosidimutans]KRT15342.1 four helix bundle protein [Pedobacter ginsenosidimutans]